MASPSSPEAHLTLVLIDSAGPEALVRCAQQALRTGSEFSLVLVTANTSSVPAAVGRRARVVRSSTTELEAVAAQEASRSALVVLAPTSTAFSRGWTDEVRARAAMHSQAISVYGAYGRSVLVVPAEVTDTHGTRLTWIDAACLRLRGHATGGARRQTLGAVMIVKDEEDVLDECLTALKPFVDEVVVYDTGSSDRTVEIARSHGVKVIEGYWNDHFGDARNRALEHATCDWVLQIDADEVITGDIEALRRQLDTEVHDQVSLTIVSTNYRGGTTGMETQPARFFRRNLYRWTGALHEYPDALPGVTIRGMSPQHSAIRVLHSGYQQERTESRDKTSRNLALATKELMEASADDPARAVKLSNQGRSLMWAGKVDEALRVFEELRSTQGNPTSIVSGGRAAMEGLLGTNRLDEVEPWLKVMADNGESAGNLAFFRARRHLALNEHREALECMEDVKGGRGGTDTWGTPFDTTRIDVIEAAANVALGEPARAAELLVELVRTSPAAVPFDLLVRAVSLAGRPLEDAAVVASHEFIERTIREAAAQHPLLALAWFEALFTTHPEDPRPVVAGNVFAVRAGWRVALVWAMRALELGLSDVNALTTMAGDAAMPLHDRCMASALLAQYFSQAAMFDRFEQLTQEASSSTLDTLVVDLREIGVEVSSIGSESAVGS
ncbi:Glycosyl transferase family 2 [Quadrisphaera granulorum]|uniref:Glycosyl transferase family 2 n=1 Tax=Quadrisphaera granulorum TaxID=317664 RepID=A0A316A709_9ACTN|nr:glycosyltransferase family 2 protein [Quadrisphaera granulorum]PWJ52604.1 glycosyl transferase family 2 [Quadrisphaera granulorum]SZE97654.1 Glycosyl transferase family 2 [Quadrisphaera granulorum]